MFLRSVGKSVSGWTIRYLSYLLPKILLFQAFLVVRRFHVRLSQARAPQILLKGIDHVFYSLRPAVLRTRLGDAEFLFRLNDPCHYNLILGAHEPAIVEWLARNVKGGMTVFDIGANVGFYTLLTARLVGDKGRVVSIEPDPQAVEILKQNIHANALTNVDVVQGAAYGKCGEVRLGCAPASSWSGISYRNAVQWIEVLAYTVDALASRLKLGRVDFVKIDVEGAEREVLDGMVRVLREDRPIVLVELHDRILEAHDHPTLQQFRRAKYRVFYLTDQHIIAQPEE
jgi:FkbM family methyltransferase